MQNRGNGKAGSHQEMNPGHLACKASALPLSYDKQTMLLTVNSWSILIHLMYIYTSLTLPALEKS